MAWLRRSRFRSRVQKTESAPLSRPKLTKDSSGGSSTSVGSSAYSERGAQPPAPGKKLGRKTQSLRIDTGREEPKKVGRRFFSFLKKKDPSPAPTKFVHRIGITSPTSDDGTIDGTVETSDITDYSSSHSTASTPSSSDGTLHMIPMDMDNVFTGLSTDEDDGSDAELCFRSKRMKKEPSIPSLVSPRQSSEMSQLTAFQSEGSGSRHSLYSERSHNSSDGSVSSTRSDKSATLAALFDLRGELSAIPDNSYHSTVTEEASHISASMHGNSKHGSDQGNNLDRIRENMEMDLYLRTVPLDDDEELYRAVVPPAPTAPTAPLAQSTVAKKLFPKVRSFLPPVQQETLPFSTRQEKVSPPPRAVTPPTAQARDRTPSPTLAKQTQGAIGGTYLIPLTLERDLSLEESTGSKSQLPSDLSLDQYSIVTDSLLAPDTQVLPSEDSSLRKSLEDVLSDLRHTDEADHRHHRPGSSGCNTSGCNTTSSSEDMGAAIRSGMLNGSLFDSEPDSSSCTNSSSRGSTAGSIPYRNMEDGDVVMEERSQVSESSYHFCNLPQELQNDRVSMSGDDNSDSEVATASSDEDIAHLEELYSDIFGDEECAGLLDPVSASEEESDLSSGTLSMLGLFKDDKSCQSSVVSFDSSEFLEDEQGEQFEDYSSLHSRSKASCSISMHDITTIHEENEDDIAEEDEEDHLMAGMDMDIDQRLPMPLNGELHLRRSDLITPGSSGTFSSVTDDSYMGCMSFDSLSLVSERGNSPRGFYRKVAGGNGVKIDMSNHQDFVNQERPTLQQPFNDESSQFTFESSRVSVGDSACSYDSFSSESVKYMVDILKEEAERRRNKIKERIAKIRESTDRATHTSKYVAHRLDKGNESDSTMSGTL